MSNEDGTIGREVAKSLLSALRAMGRAPVAAVFEREFEARNWALRATDQSRLLAALQPDPQLTFLPTAQLPLTAGKARPSSAPVPDAVRHHAPFLAAIQDGDRLLRALDRLARASTRPSVRAATVQLFVDVLGFDLDEVDQTHRVGARSQLAYYQTLARHGDFQVALVEITEQLSDTQWSAASNHFAPCFRLAPYGLLVAIEPAAGTLRFVYASRGRGGRPWYRAMVGPWRLRDPNDDLLVWCKRFDLLRPRFGDDAVAVRERLEEVLDAPAAEIARQWASAPLPIDDPLPGLPFGAAAVQAQVNSFLQPTTPPDERLIWGLEDALRQVFPAPLVYGQWRLACAGYALGREADDANECWRRGETRAREVQLRLSVSTWQGQKVHGSEFSLPALLPVPDELGRFVIDGDPFLFRPRIGADGRFLTPAVLDEDDDDDEEDPDDDVDGLEDDASDVPIEDGAWKWAIPEGVTLDRFLRHWVERRLLQHLRGVRHTVRALLADDAPPDAFGRAVRAGLAMRVDAGGRLPLVPRAGMLRLLDPIALDDDALHHVISAPDGAPTHPPTWACPITSSVAEGRWVPIAAARIHPCGTFSVPAATEAAANRQLRLVVPAPGAPFDATAFPRRWALAPLLEPWASASALHRPDALVRADELATTCIVRSAALADGAAWLAPRLRPRIGRRARLSVDVPSRPGVPAAPTLCVTEGARASGGDPWLRIPWEAVPWHAAPPRNVVDEALGYLASVPAEDAGVTHRVPPGSWRIVGVGLERTFRGRRASSGWRAWLELVEDGDGRGALVDDRGRWYRLVDAPDDVPWSAETGDEPDVVLGSTGVETDGVWYSGADGELSDTVTDRDARVWLCAPTEVLWTEATPPRALLSGGWRSGRSLPRFAHREWAAMRPTEVASAVTQAPGPFGHAPSLLQCARALLAARVPLPAVFPDAWRVADEQSLAWVEPLDCVPTETSLHRFSPGTGGKVRHPALLAATCGCGAWTGAWWRGRRCGACGDTVQDRPAAIGPQPAIRLPWPVLHPWRKDLAGAVLGLTAAELDEVLLAWGPVHLRLAIAQALERGPMDAARRRLMPHEGDANRLPTGERRAFGLVVRRLERRLAVDPELGALWLDAVPVPAPELMPGGLVLGAHAPVATPLLAAFQRLRRGLSAAAELRREPSDTLQRAAHVAVQRAMDGLFGPVDAPAGWGSLAAILSSSWPWSRPGSEPISLPGLTWLGGEHLDELFEDRDEVRLVPLSGRQVPDEPVAPRSVTTVEQTWEEVPLLIEESRRKAVDRLVWGASPQQLRCWARPHGLGPFGSMAGMRIACARQIGLQALLAAMTDGELDWAYWRLTGARAPELGRADLQEEIVASGSAAVTQRPRTIRRRSPAAIEPSPWTIPSGCVALRPAPHRDPQPGVLVGDQLLLLPNQQAPAGWEVQRAVARLRSAWWPWLSAVIEHVAENLPDHVAPTSPDVAIAGLAVALHTFSPGAPALLALVEATKAVSLPADAQQAHEAMVERLRALDDGSMAARALVDVLAVAWSGWCRGEPSAERAAGVVYSASGMPPDGMRRALLPATHPAWLQWPAVLFVTRPARFAEQADLTDWAPGDALRRWVGLMTLEAPSLEGLLRPAEREDQDAVPPAGDPTPIDEAVVEPPYEPVRSEVSVAPEEPEDPAPPEDPGDIRWWPGSPAAWIRAHLRGRR
jgi:hypothetical protein